MKRPASHAREILRLAVPAFGALIAEPLFLLADSAIVGHLGVAQLAGVGLASAVLHTAVGLMVFLAYSTTPAVARAIGDGQLGKALAAGRDGVWLALLLGMVLAVAGFVAAEPLVDLMGADGDVRSFAVDYLRWSMPGLVAMLLIFAGTGVLRGLQDTRTPLVVATAGFALNIVLNLWLVYGLDWSVTGSAAGTSMAQWAMAAVYLVMVQRNAARHGISLWPDWQRHPRHDQGGFVADAPDAEPAHRHPGNGFGGHGPGCREPGRAPAGHDHLHLPRLCTGCPGHRRAGPDRQGTGRLQPRQGAAADPDHDPLGHRIRRGHGRPAGRRPRPGQGPCSLPTPASSPS